MSNGNPFYVKPATAMVDWSPLGQGLGAVAAQSKAKRDREAAADEVKKAFESGDEAAMLDVITRRPELAEQMKQRIGFANQMTERTLYDAYEGLDMAIESAKITDDEGNVTGYDPDVLEQAGGYFDEQIEAVKSYGGQPLNMGYDRERLMSDPEALQQQIQKGKMIMQPDLYASMSGQKLPKSIQEWNYFNRMDKPTQDRYLEMKRGGWTTQDIGNVPHAVNPNTQQVIPLSDLTREAEGAATVAGATKEAQVTAGAQAEAKANLPLAEAKHGVIIDQISKVMEHPALEVATGFTGAALEAMPDMFTAGTGYADFQTLRKQLQGKTFLSAFETLKGGGQITEVEGTKATEAMARLQAAQTDKAFISALRDFDHELNIMMDVGYQKAAGKPVYNQKTGQLLWEMPDGSYKKRYQ